MLFYLLLSAASALSCIIIISATLSSRDRSFQRGVNLAQLTISAHPEDGPRHLLKKTRMAQDFGTWSSFDDGVIAVITAHEKGEDWRRSFDREEEMTNKKNLFTIAKP